MKFRAILLVTALKTFELLAGTAQTGETILSRPVDRPEDFDCSEYSYVSNSHPIPHYVDWDQDGYLEKLPVLLCESKYSGNVDVGPLHSLSSHLARISEIKDGYYVGEMRLRYLHPVPVYKTLAMQDFEFDCEPDDGYKFQTYATLGPDIDGDGIPSKIAPKEICTGNYETDGTTYWTGGFDRQNQAIDWKIMSDRLLLHSFLKPERAYPPALWTLVKRDYYYWEGILGRIKGREAWGYGYGFGFGFYNRTLIDCDDNDTAVPYGAVYKDSDKDGYPDSLLTSACTDPSFQGKNWITQYVSATNSSGDILRPVLRVPQPSQIDCAPKDPEIYEDCCADLETAEGRMKVFKSGFDPKKYSRDGSGGMVLYFAPMCSDGKPVQLKHLAKSFGFDHFNWWQSMSNKGAVTYTVSDSTLYRIYTEDNPSVPFSELRAEPELWVVDPVLKKYGNYFLAIVDPASQTWRGAGLRKDEEGVDDLPYYLTEGEQVQSRTTKYNLKFEDYPYMPIGWFGDRLQQPPTEFKTRVAGVKADKKFVMWSIEHNWISNKEHCNEDKPEECALDRPFEFAAQNLSPPPGYETSPGGVSYQGVSGLDLIVTPDLVGRSSDSVSVSRFLSGSGFTMTVTGYQSSPSIPAGVVISQTPEPLSEVRTRGEIKVVVSTGISQDCGPILNGQTTTRIRYLQSEVSAASSCEDVKEVQTGVCTNGNLVFNGTATFDSCTVKAPASCGGIPHGGTTVRTRYSALSVPFGSSCESIKEEQVGTCSNGSLTFTGTAAFETCTVNQPASCGSIPHGDTTVRTMYLESSVPFGSSCESLKEEQLGTCSNGTLTFNGMAAFETCSVAQPASCGDIPHGGTTSRTMYRSPEVMFGENCEAMREEQTASCFNGVLSYSGTAQYESCKVLPPVVVGCEKVKTEVCKAHLFQTKTCKVPGTITHVDIDRTYKGSTCHQVPEIDSWWDLIKVINSYSVKGDRIKVYYGCDAKFKIKYIGNCKTKD